MGTGLAGWANQHQTKTALFILLFIIRVASCKFNLRKVVVNQCQRCPCEIREVMRSYTILCMICTMQTIFFIFFLCFHSGYGMEYDGLTSLLPLLSMI